MPEWTTSTIAEIADKASRSIAIGPFGSALKAEVYSRAGVPVVRGQDITVGKSLSAEDRVYVPEDVAAQFPACIVRDGDLVFPHRGAIGRVGIVSGEELLISSSLMKLSVDRSRFDPLFVFYYFRWRGRDELLARASTVGTPGIGQPLASLRGIPITYPPLDSQRAIAEVLGALDDKIAANGTIEQQTRNLLMANFEGLGFDVEPTQDPCTLDTLIEINPRTASPTHDDATYLDMKNLPDRALTIRKWSQRPAKGGARFRNGDTLLARITPCLENGKVGYADFLRDDEVGVGSTEFIVLRSRPEIPAVLPYFFATSERFREHAIRHMSGTTGRQRLAAADVGAYLVQPPLPKALGQFGELASSLVPMLRRLVDQSEQLAVTRDELLPLLMSGRVTVRDVEGFGEAWT